MVHIGYSGFQWLVVVLDCSECFSVVFDGSLWLSVVVFNGSQWFSITGSRSQWFTVVVSGYYWFSMLYQ